MTAPSFDGVTPMSLAWIAFSIALIALLSYAAITSTRGSGTEKLASCCSGTSEP